MLHVRVNKLAALFWVVLGLVLSESVLSSLFSPDRHLAPPNRLILLAFDGVMLFLGICAFLWRKSPRMAGLNVSLIAVFVCLAGIEGYLRVTRVDPVWAQREIEKIRVPDPFLHHALVPNSSGVIWWVDRKVPYFVNSAGFRDARVRDVPPRTRSQARVVLLGDSFTEALGVPYEKSFACRLEALFREGGADVEVLNAGVAAYCPRIYYRRLQKFLDEGFSTDIAIVMMDMTDAWDEAVFYSDNDFSDECARQLQESRRKRVDVIVSEQQRDRTYYLVYPALLIEVSRLLSGWGKDPWEWLNSYSDGAFAWTEDRHFDKPWVAVGLERCKLHLEHIKRLCDEHGIEMFLAVFPQPPQLSSPRRPSRQEVIFSEFAQENGIKMIDLYPGFRALKDWRKAYIKWDNHFSPKGHEVVARQLHDELVRSSGKLGVASPARNSP